MSIGLIGSSMVLSLRYSNIFFVISQILFSMLVINVYSIVDSKVFPLIIGTNFLFAIIIERFYDCKHEIEEERMQLRSTYANNAN
jgi:hypothetical protein